MFLVFLMYALFASVFTAGKYTLQFVQPFFLTGIRMIFAGSILLLFIKIKYPEKLYVRKNHWTLLILIGLFNVFITNAFEFWGLQYMSSAKTCLIYSLSPFVAIVFSYVLLKEKMNLRKWIGLIIGLVGFVPIYLSRGGKEVNIISFGVFSLAEIAVTISAFTAVIGWIFIKKLTKQMNYPFFTANAISFFIGGAMSLIVSAFFEKWRPLPVTNYEYFVYGLVYISIIHNVICYNLYAYSLQKFTINFMTFAGITSPVFTAIFGILFLKEKVGWPFFLSLFVVFLGLLIFSIAELSNIRLNKR
jgi:drug/metabolite transporter (DMT)-like permease